MKKTYIIFAGPGGGKGTQCKLLVDKHNFAHISTGDLIRDAISDGTIDPEILKKTNFISDDVMSEILWKELSKHDEQHVIIDGFPRAGNQHVLIHKILEDVDRKIDGVFMMRVWDSTLKERLMKRETRVGESTTDKEANVNKRIQAYNDETVPVILKLERTIEPGIYHVIDGERTVEAIHTDIVSYL